MDERVIAVMMQAKGTPELAGDVKVADNPDPQGEDLGFAPRLDVLIPGDPELREAMEYFLLAAPQRQLDQLGDPQVLKRSGDKAGAAGDNMTARINYENAAKIALYYDNAEDFENMLRSAESVTPSTEGFSQFHRTLLSQVESALKIAKIYYGQIAKTRAAIAKANEEIPPMDSKTEAQNGKDSTISGDDVSSALRTHT
jgi:hypothetical protein